MISILILNGISGSGKTTIAQELKKKYKRYSIVSSGDIVRAIHAKLPDDKREEDMKFIQQYGLSQYDDEIKSKIIASIDKKKDYVVLDGYPRTVDQLLGLYKSYNIIAVNVDINPVVAMNRLIERGREDIMIAEGVIKAQYDTYHRIKKFISLNDIKYITINANGNLQKGVALVHAFYEYCKDLFEKNN